MPNMFNKILFLNFQEANLKPEYWNRIDKITKRKILINADSLEVKKHLNADCLLLKLGIGADKSTIDRMPNLKYIGMYGTGYGRIDAAYAAKKGITVCNIAGYATEGVAEFVFGTLIAFFRDITRAKMQAENGDYSESSYTGTEIKDKTYATQKRRFSVHII